MTPPGGMPTWEQMLLPVLTVLSDGAERGRRGMSVRVSDHVGLSDEQRSEVLESGQPKADNRIGWALSALARSAAIARPRRGRYVIAARGHELIAAHPDGLTAKLLFPDAARRLPKTEVETPQIDEPDLDPLEQIEQGMNRLRTDVAVQLLDALRAQTPDFLERVVLDVLVAMGYGGTDRRAQRLGGSGDGGVDGVIDQDALGLERIYVQAKRYEATNSVGREAIQAFVGALHGRHASSGVFITTSTFTSHAVDYAATISSRVILIDGERLARLMIQYGVGVQTVHEYRAVRLDVDFFEGS